MKDNESAPSSFLTSLGGTDSSSPQTCFTNSADFTTVKKFTIHDYSRDSCYAVFYGLISAFIGSTPSVKIINDYIARWTRRLFNKIYYRFTDRTATCEYFYFSFNHLSLHLPESRATIRIKLIPMYRLKGIFHCAILKRDLTLYYSTRFKIDMYA